MVDAETVAHARRRLGHALASFRRAAGYTQHQLAPLLQYGRSTLANVETGRQSVGRTFWERCDEILRADGVLIRGYDDLQALVRDHHLSRAGTEASTNRRDFTKLFAAAIAAGVDPTTLAARRTRVDSRLVASHQQVAENLAGLYRHADPRTTLPMATAYADEVLDLLDQPMGERERLDMAQLVVGLHAQIGLWACHLHRPAMAYRYLATACDVAAGTGDPSLHARALGAFSYLFSSAPRGGHGGNPRRALALLDAALLRAARADGFTRGWLATWRADQHASLGNLRAARADIHTAARELASGTNPAGGGFFSRTNYGYGFPGHVARLRALIAALHREVHDFGDLKHDLIATTTNLRHRVAALGYLAMASAAAGDAERASASLSEALAHSVPAGYTMGVTRVLGVRSRFCRSWEVTQTVRQLDERLRLLVISEALI